MTFAQVKDILRMARSEHVRIADFYEEMEDSVNNEKVRRLLENMKGHENELINCLNAYIKSGEKATLNTWFQSLPEAPPLELIDIPPDATSDEVLSVYEGVNDYFIEYYKKLMKLASFDRTNELFEEMIRMEKNDQMRESWCKVMADDL